MNHPVTEPVNAPAPEVQVFVLSRDYSTSLEILGIYASQSAVEWAVIDMLRKGQDLGGLCITPWTLIGAAGSVAPSPRPRA